jgi:hypothetical protein
MQYIDFDLYEIPDQAACVYILFEAFEDKILSDIILESEGIDIKVLSV